LRISQLYASAGYKMLFSGAGVAQSV